MSGGVITAERIRTNTIANFLFVFKNLGVTIPILVKKYMSIGSSEIKPEERTEALSKLM